MTTKTVGIFPFRVPSALTIGTQWPMPLHPKTQPNNNNYQTSVGNATKSAIHRNQSIPGISFKQNDNATPRLQSNQFSINSSKSITSMPSIHSESVKLWVFIFVTYNFAINFENKMRIVFIPGLEILMERPANTLAGMRIFQALKHHQQQRLYLHKPK